MASTTNNTTNTNPEDAGVDKGIPTTWCMPSAGCHDDPVRNTSTAAGWQLVLCLLAALVIVWILFRILLDRLQTPQDNDDDDKTVSVADEEEEDQGTQDMNSQSTVVSSVGAPTHAYKEQGGTLPLSAEQHEEEPSSSTN